MVKTMALYNDTVMEHFMNPHNVGEIENPDGKGIYGSPVCGDMMQVTIFFIVPFLLSSKIGIVLYIKPYISWMEL